MKRLTKILPVCGVLVLAATGLVACGGDNGGQQGGGGSSSGELELEVSTASTQSDWYKTILAEYNTQREAEGKAKIKFTFVVHEENVLQTEVADWAKGPDLFSYVGDQTNTLYLKRALATIPEEYQAAIKEENGTQEVATYATYVNKMIGYPYAADNGYFLYYDKDVLNENDVKTWDGIMAKATEARQFGYDAGNAWMSMGALFTFGADYQVKFTKQGNISSVNASFNTAEGLKSAKFLKQFYIDKAELKNLTTAAERAPTAANALCATIAGSHCLAGFKRQLGDKLGMAKLPTITVDGVTKTLGSFLGYKLFGVNNAKGDAERKALAHEVARYLTSADVQEKRFQEFSVMPSIKTLQQKQAVLEDAHVLAIKDQVAANAAHPQTTVPGKCWEAPNTFTTAISAKVDDNAAAEMTDAWLQEQLEIMNDSIKASK